MSLGRMANPRVFQIHRYRVLTVFFFQPIRIVVLSELRPVAINLGKPPILQFLHVTRLVCRGHVGHFNLDFNGVCRPIWKKRDLFFSIFKGENNSWSNLKGFMSRKSKENVIEIENRVQ